MRGAFVRVAVIQHARQDTPTQDVALLLESAADACSNGADVVVLPRPTWLAAADIDSVAGAAFLADEYPDVTLLAGPFPAFVGEAEADARAARSAARVRETPLGRTAFLADDECIDVLIAEELVAAEPDAIVLRPGSESDLQAEAMLERALGLSESASGLVIVAEADGSAPGEAGHGGSAIAVLGDVIAEAEAGNAVLLAEVAAPMSSPDERSALPTLPPILAQRWALHHGERLHVDYPADVT
jgi:hypothetical protein